MSVHARFRLTEDTRASFWHNGSYRDAARIKLAAIQGEPFGPATPQGTIEMLIVNPDAIKIFREAALGQEFDVLLASVASEK